jgi:IS30 family transposase
MSKRGYTRIKGLVPVIQTMVSEGKTYREIAEYYGLKNSEVVREALRRHRRNEKKMEAGIQIRRKGRPRKDGQPPKEDIQKEVERLRMENKLLQDFLQFVERK